ncbi:MAG: ATP synthase F1 subunit delta [Chloroflexi bacterium]|nr:ATP synthase F1 subunit delta [Chloroflexota bacterium]
MPRRTTAAKRFAEALAGLARPRNTWQRWREQLGVVDTAMHDPALRLSLDSPRLPMHSKQERLRGALRDAVDDEIRNLVLVMAQRGRLELLPDLITWFGDLADQALGIRHYTVTSAVPLTEQERRRLRAQLTGRDGQVVIVERVDPAVLGGLVLQQGDVIHDYSLRGRLESLRARLN